MKSQFSDNLSKLSKVFVFDTTVFSSRIYQRVFRGSLKESLRRKQDTRPTLQLPLITDAELQSNGIALDNQRYAPKRVQMKSIDMDEKCVINFLSSIKRHSLVNDTTELKFHRLAIKLSVFNFAFLLVKEMEKYDILPKLESSKLHYNYLRTYLYPFTNAHIEVALRAIWKDPCIPKLLEYSTALSFYNTPYILDQWKELRSPDYIPSKGDILWTKTLPHSHS
ncbi:hypothetical protein K505DRAFT_358428 [Melanomma pulvis-pyrius CBS 109.77]|uniref:Uncharacterized protein n=1 Tax=Melanomma pulvis-pyrius CBS 109.77 TaxID=1314802 RepID=A0A6A6XNE8_9PLEO|nr:hypothetical protein K505DRAFT_358428 [Melanomma pulvis-pyrius CBS 109.77]